MTAYDSFGNNPIVKEVLKKYYGSSLDFLYEMIRLKEIEYTSFELFNGSVILMYPKIELRCAKKDYMCDFSGAKISKGIKYINYQALFIDLYSKAKYIIKPSIKVEQTFESSLPLSINEIDELELYARLGEYKDGIYYDILNKQYGGIPIKRIRNK